jgi:TatD DNase family protein
VPEPVLVDTHCHLDAAQFASEPVASVVARAVAAGVTRMVTIGTDLATSAAALRLAEAQPQVWATVGVDPNDCAGFDATALDRLAALAASPRVVAVGEIGLDYYWNRAPRATQLEAFEAQLALAEALDLPVVIHSRDALDDTEAVLAAWAAARPRQGRPVGVLHCYSGDLARAERLVMAGFLVSLAGVVTYRNAGQSQAVAAGLPLEALVLETDAPYLAPHPHRGARNEPANVRPIAAHVAALRGTDLATVAVATTANAARLFRWDQP